jgi:hypothetical protein
MIKRILFQALTGKSSDGLTKKQRKALAEAYIRKAGRRLTEQEKEAFATWRERRL